MDKILIAERRLLDEKTSLQAAIARSTNERSKLLLRGRLSGIRSAEDIIADAVHAARYGRSAA